MAKQGELFGVNEAAVPGLVFVHGAITAGEEKALTAQIDRSPLKPFEFGQWRGKRLTTHYGSAYDFTRGLLGEAPPLPDWLIALR
jgi:DNA oxidative demethylase